MIILLNTNAGSAAQAEPVRAWAADRGHSLRETESAAEARSLAKASAQAGEVVVAAGGDGTIHVVAQGVLDAATEGSLERRPVLGVVPLGTGNDLARSLNLPTEIEEVLALLERGRTRPIDALRLLEPVGDARTGWCLNVASGGFSGLLNQAVTDELKERWGALAYALASLTCAAEAKPFGLVLDLDGERLAFDDALNVVLANGRYAGGGFQVAPEARLDDALAEVLVIRNGTWLERAGLGASLLSGDYTDAEVVSTHRAREIQLSLEAPIGFSIDGELSDLRSLTVEVVPALLETFAAG